VRALPPSPLAAAAILFAAGLLVPPRSGGPAAGAVAAALLAAGALLLRDRRRGPALRAGGALVLASFLPLGLLARAAGASRGPDRVTRLLARHGEIFATAVEVEGVLGRDPAPRSPPDDGCSLEVALVRIRGGRLSLPASGTVRIHAPPPPEGVADPCALARGTRIRAAAALSAPRSFGNPGAVDYAALLRARGIDAVGRASGARLVETIAPPPPLDRVLGRVRGFVVGSLEDAFREGAGGRGAGIARALLLGDRAGVAREDERALQAAGTSHLLAVSGFNVAVVAAAARALWRIVRPAPGPLAVLVGASLLAYLALTGREPSVERAVAGAILHLSGLLLGRRGAPLNTVGAAGLLLAAAAPAAVHDASFQLTFVAAGALAAFAPSAAASLPGPRWLAASIGVNAVALAATSPLTASLFNRVTPGALAANLAASPLMALALLATAAIPAARIVGAALGLVGVEFREGLAPAAILARSASLAVEAALGASRAASAVPGASYLCVTPPGWLTSGALAAGAAAALAWRRGPTRPGRGSIDFPRAAAAAFLAGTVLSCLPGEGILGRERDAPARSGLRLTVFDVGQGSASLIETPGGARLLVDAGGFARSALDVGERVVGRALLSLGVRRLDAVAVSHGDFDHAGGMRAILEMFPGGEIWVAAAERDAGRLGPLLDAAARRGRALRLLAAGRSFEFSGARVEALHPPRTGGGLGANDRSLVLRVEAGGRALLLPGDVESAGEGALLDRLAPCDAILVPHHGSRTSSTLPFLRAAGAAWGIVSCGASNRFGHPHPEALARLAAARTRVLRTDRDGAVRITLPPDTARPAGGAAEVEVFSGGGWRPAEAREAGP
jgi:competence protein ComEC